MVPYRVVPAVAEFARRRQLLQMKAAEDSRYTDFTQSSNVWKGLITHAPYNSGANAQMPVAPLCVTQAQFMYHEV